MGGLLAKIFGWGDAGTENGGSRPEDDTEQLLLCPSCGDEYRTGFHSCAVCGCELVAATDRDSGSEGTRLAERLGDKPVEIGAGEEVVTIRQVTLAEGKRLRRLLGRYGIGAALIGEGPPPGGGCCPPASIQLQIRPRDAEAAQRLLQEDYRRLTGLAELQTTAGPERNAAEQAEVARCAACGHVLTAGQQECPDCGLCRPPVG
jgi:hypothetical protein